MRTWGGVITSDLSVYVFNRILFIIKSLRLYSNMVADLVAAVVVIFFSWWRQPLQQTLRRWGWRRERYCFFYSARYPQVISALASWTSCLKWQAVTSAKTARQEKQTPPCNYSDQDNWLMGVQFHLRTRHYTRQAIGSNCQKDLPPQTS